MKPKISQTLAKDWTLNNISPLSVLGSWYKVSFWKLRGWDVGVYIPRTCLSLL